MPRGSVNYVCWFVLAPSVAGCVSARPWSATVGKSSSVFIARTVLRAAALTSRVSLYRAPWFSELRVLVRVSALGSGLCLVVIVVRPWFTKVDKSSSVFIAWTVLREAALAIRVSLYRAPWFSELRVGSC